LSTSSGKLPTHKCLDWRDGGGIGTIASIKPQNNMVVKASRFQAKINYNKQSSKSNSFTSSPKKMTNEQMNACTQPK